MKNPDFGENRKIAILLKIDENFKFRQNLRKNVDFIRSISILVQISENLDFGENFWKLLIEVKIFEISRFWPKLKKIAILG